MVLSLQWLKTSFIFLFFIKVIVADFGDYVDPTYNCPAMTTCQQVCVPNVSDCPVAMLCGDNQTLCADGSCAESCSPDLETPCAYKCAPVACHKIVDDYGSCLGLYGTYYDFESTCGAEEEAEELKLYNYNEAGFVFFYTWISVVSVLIVAWCVFNQRISPVPDSTQTLNLQAENDASSDSESETSSWQTGYKLHPVGLFIHFLTLVTLFGFQGLLGWLSVQFYVTEGKMANLNQRFDDSTQILKLFQIVWMLGFVWSFLLKWPYSIGSLFLRRCRLEEATHVAVFVIKPGKEPEVKTDVSYFRYLRWFLSGVSRCVGSVMSFIFSDIDARRRSQCENGVYKFCRIRKDNDGTHHFLFMFRRYNLDYETGKYVAGVWDVGSTIEDIVIAGSTPGGLSTVDVEARRHVVGWNSIEMSRPYFIKTLYNEFSKPFYTYQAFMVWSWMPLFYFYMAVVWSIVITTGALTVSFFQYRNELNLFQIAVVTGNVAVIRDGGTISVPQEELVPGDIVRLQPGLAFCDMALIQSATTLIDESALTGEATPMSKVSLGRIDGHRKYDRKNNKRQTILAGTVILECDDSLAVVTHTASFTARGELLREIFSYKRYRMKFDVEVMIVLAILCLYAIFGFAMVYYFIQETPVYGWYYGIYVVGTTLPPLLPTVFTVSVGVSNDRLARKRIACAQAESILVAGKVTRAFFDKTGTLTKQGLDFVSTRSAAMWTSNEMTKELSLAMAVCHNLTLSQYGEMVGNPVDRTMFEASGATTADKGAVVNVTSRHGESVEIVKHFDFDHDRMTQSVIVRKSSDNQLVAYVKGSGESIQKICNKETLPGDFEQVLTDSAKMGTYQISVATKTIQSDVDLTKISRDDVESSLTFLGVMDFKNVLRDETPSVIKELEEGEVKSIMVTGDSVLTGIKIAREAGIIKPNQSVLVGSVGHGGDVVWVLEVEEEDEKATDGETVSLHNSVLALSGQAWAALRATDSYEADRLMENIRVVGRCTPYDKVSVVSAYVEKGYVTLMCGDGGNDCGALKTAHVGIALSDAEASIVAPFTSLDKTIAAVPEVLKEGRCALASALAAYKYLILYGQIETINQIVNAYFKITFAEWCWVFMDGFWTITMAISLPLARAAKKLSPTRPTSSLLGLQTLSSALGVLILNFCFTVSGLAYLWHQDWFQCRKWTGQDVSNVLVIGDNYESEVLFLITGFQYISSAMAFNFGYEFRQAWICNYVFVGLALFYTTVQFYITLVPSTLSCVWRVNCENEDVIRSVTSLEPVPIQNAFNTTVMPEYFRRGLIGIMVGNAIAICAYDYFVVNGIRRYYAAKRRRERAHVALLQDQNNHVAVSMSQFLSVPAKEAAKLSDKEVSEQAYDSDDEKAAAA